MAARPVLEPALSAALDTLRFEIFPSRRVEDELGFLPPGQLVPVTCSPVQGIEATLSLCERVAARGLVAVPHVSARLVESREHLAQILERLTGDELFVIAGDVRDPIGPYGSALALLRDVFDLGYDALRIGIAGYPEPHPLIDEGTLRRALAEKQPFASYLVTQMCFDAGAIVRWLRARRRAGIELPVYVGIPGVCDPARLLKFALQVGVGESVRFLEKQRSVLGKLFRRGFHPDRIVEKLSPSLGDPALGIQGFHAFTFNEIEATERWRRETIARIGG